MEMSQEEAMRLARERMKREAALQGRLAMHLYKGEENALMRWSEDVPNSPSDRFRAYISDHPEVNLNASSPEELEAVLKAAGITIH